jgi:outer membrane protein
MRSPFRFAFAALTVAVTAALATPTRADDLLEVYRDARASDPQLQIAEANKRVSEAGVTITRSNLLPDITGTAGFTDTDNHSNAVDVFPQDDGSLQFGAVTSGTDTRQRDYRITLRQSVFNYGNWTALKSSRALADKGEADYETALDTLFIRVSTAYFNALTAKTNLEAAQAQEKAVGRQLEQAEQRFEVGLTAITDVHEARAQHDASRAAVILAESQLSDAYEALAELTGKPVQEARVLRADIPLAPPEPADANAWVKVALEQSPTLRAQEFALKSADYDVRTARSGHYPFLDANASYADTDVWGGRTSNGFARPATFGQEGNVIGLTLTVPIFSGLETTGRIHQAVARRDAATDLLEQNRRAVTRTTLGAYRDTVAGISEVQARKQALISAQSALEATQAGFEVGTRTIVDVLLSQQNLFAAQREYARARHNYLLAGLRLKQSAGVIDVKDIEAVNALLQP